MKKGDLENRNTCRFKKSKMKCQNNNNIEAAALMNTACKTP